MVRQDPAGPDAVSGLDLRRQRDQELMKRVDQQARAVAAQAEAELRESITAKLHHGKAELRECLTQLISGAQEREVVPVGHGPALRHEVGAERARSWSWPQERHEVNLSGSPTRRSSSLFEGCSAQASAPVVPQAASAKVLDGGDSAGSEAAVDCASKRGSCSEEPKSGGYACGIASISIGTAGCGGGAEGGAWAQEQQEQQEQQGQQEQQEREIVRLNVGGQSFCTTLQTLRSQDSMLAAMFSGRFRPGPSDAQVDGCSEPFAPKSILTWHPDAVHPDTRCAVRCAGRAHRPRRHLLPPRAPRAPRPAPRDPPFMPRASRAAHTILRTPAV